MESRKLISVKQFVIPPCAFCQGEITDEIWTVRVDKTNHTMCGDCASTIKQLFDKDEKLD